MTKKRSNAKVSPRISCHPEARACRFMSESDENGKRIYKSFTDPDPIMAIQAALDYKQHTKENRQNRRVSLLARL